jgi:hypothetical protein
VGRFSGKEVDASFADICIPERSACQPVRTRHSKKHWSGRPEESLISLQSAAERFSLTCLAKTFSLSTFGLSMEENTRLLILFSNKFF